MKCSLGISNFLEEISSLSHSIVFLYFFALIPEEGFLISILWNSAFRWVYLFFLLCLWLPLPSLINNCLNLTPGAQGKPWRLNERCFLKSKKWGTQKPCAQKPHRALHGIGRELGLAFIYYCGPWAPQGRGRVPSSPSVVLKCLVHSRWSLKSLK